MSHDALELIVIHDVHQPSSGSDNSILWVATSCERIWGWVIDDVDLGHWHALGDAQVLDDVPKPRVVALLDLVSTAHRNCH